ncbi:hypothetical protein CP533_4880 [Ophiocordyceps camponoti-saundersi (nom. inval.)]|nr:hypothetical protein CP533_4880 [Ophiocordyceps camponoti-saundersi (nom. inval.)]
MKFGLVLLSSGLAMAVPQTAQGEQGACDKKCGDVEVAEGSCNKPDLSEHKTCMCGSETAYFSKWKTCRECLRDTAKVLPPAKFDENLIYLNKARAGLCDGTPTASFQALWVQASGSVEVASKSDVPASVTVPTTTPASSYGSKVTPTAVMDSVNGPAAEASAGADATVDENGARAKASALAKAQNGGSAKANAYAEASKDKAVAGADAAAEHDGTRVATSTSTTAGASSVPFKAPSSPAVNPAKPTIRTNGTTTGAPATFTGAAAPAGVASGLVTAVFGAAAALLAL